MPPLETADHYDYAALWEYVGHDSTGHPVVREPVEISCRWEEDRRDTVDAQGNTIATDVTVFLSRDVPVNSILRFGLVSSIPSPPDNLMIVVTKNTAKDLKNRLTQRDLALSRYSQRMPEIQSGTGS